jgi:hypothetical protein
MESRASDLLLYHERLMGTCDRPDRIEKRQDTSEWLLFNAISAIVQLYHGEKKLIVNEMMMKAALYTLRWIAYCAIWLKQHVRS